MVFKSDKQRKFVMAKLRGGARSNVSPKIIKLSQLNNRQLISRGIHLNPNKDFDKDGLINKLDCKPLNKKEQGFIHDVISGVGKFGGFVVGEAKAGIRDIPKEFRRQEKLTKEKERVKQEELVKSRQVQLAKFRQQLISQRQRELKELERLTKGRTQFKKNYFE